MCMVLDFELSRFLLLFPRQIIQDGGPTIKLDGQTISAQYIMGQFKSIHAILDNANFTE